MTDQASGTSDPKVDAIDRELASDGDLNTIWRHHAPGLPTPREGITVEQATAQSEEEEGQGP